MAVDPVDVHQRGDQIRLGLWMFLGTVTMLFAAFLSAYIVRRGGSDWRRVELPPVLWLNTFVLAASSAVLEAAEWQSARRRWVAATFALGATIALGLLFVAGQVAAWRALRAAGVYLPTSPHSSFFYMLTGAHAVHVVAALAVLVWGTARIWPAPGSERPRDWSIAMSVCRTFWHYLGVVWVCLFAFLGQ